MLLFVVLCLVCGEGDVLLCYLLCLLGGLDCDMLIVVLIKDGIELGCWFDDVVYLCGSLWFGYIVGDCFVGELMVLCVVNLFLGLYVGLSEW